MHALLDLSLYTLYRGIPGPSMKGTTTVSRAASADMLTDSSGSAWPGLP